jgi:hypothetical protein
MYCNLPTLNNISSSATGSSNVNLDYLQYLDKFNTFFYIPEASKVNTHKAYGQYLTALWEYLSSFFHRIQPLVSLEEEYFPEWEQDFQEKWNKGQLMGWKLPRKITTGTTAMPASEPTPLRLGMFNSAEELEALGLDRLKEGLEALGLKCGGSLSERAQRLWNVRGKKMEDIPNNLKAKKSSPANGGGGKETTNGSTANPSAAGSSAFVSLGTGDDGRRQVRISLSFSSSCHLHLLFPPSRSLHCSSTRSRPFALSCQKSSPPHVVMPTNNKPVPLKRSNC